MVYLNGDNDLECAALDDFKELASVVGSDRVKVVVQLDRAGGDCNCDCPRWSETYRFEIDKGKKPTPADAVQGLGLGEVNMGSGDELRRFVAWAQTNFPAKHYLLIISDHGDGWQTMRLKMRESLFRAARSSTPPSSGTDAEISATSTMMALTMDQSPEEDNLYVREAVDALQNLPSGRRIDVVAFESCLMGMLETAYAFRQTADFLVGSENESHQSSWNHARWLEDLVSNPRMSPAQLAARLVTAYAETQKPSTPWTLSAFRLDRIDELARATSSLAEALESTLHQGLAQVSEARDACRPFGHSNSIDLGYFCEQLATQSKDAAVVKAARRVRAEVGQAVLELRASVSTQGLYHPTGIGIFFPETKAKFDHNPDNAGYLESNQNYPVRFVREHRWDNFLLQYYYQRHFQKIQPSP